jgi:hypothetical protein
VDYFEQDNGRSGSINVWENHHNEYDCVTALPNYDDPNMRVKASRASLVQRLRRVYSALYNENVVFRL